jgi:hypothetical protein
MTTRPNLMTQHAQIAERKYCRLSRQSCADFKSPWATASFKIQGHATGKDKDISVQPSADPKTDHAVADIRHLLHTAHDANAVGALDPNHTTAPQDMTKVQLPHHHGDFHFA